MLNGRTEENHHSLVKVSALQIRHRGASVGAHQDAYTLGSIARPQVSSSNVISKAGTATDHNLANRLTAKSGTECSFVSLTIGYDEARQDEEDHHRIVPDQPPRGQHAAAELGIGKVGDHDDKRGEYPHQVEI